MLKFLTLIARKVTTLLYFFKFQIIYLLILKQYLKNAKYINNK